MAIRTIRSQRVEDAFELFRSASETLWPIHHKVSIPRHPDGWRKHVVDTARARAGVVEARALEEGTGRSADPGREIRGFRTGSAVSRIPRAGPHPRLPGMHEQRSETAAAHAAELRPATPSRQLAVAPRQAAVSAGLAYAFLNVLALFANFLVLSRLTVRDDAAATVRNIANAEVLFRGGIAAFIIVLVADVVVAWALYVFFQRTSRELSLFAAWFRLVYVAITAAALLHLLIAVKLVDDTGYMTALERGQRDVQVMLSLDAYTYGWRIGLVSFGFHLLLLGFVVVRSDYAPRVLGRMLALAGLAYVVVMLASVLLSSFEDQRSLFLLLLAVVTVPAEFGLAIWLLWRGGRGEPTTSQRAETKVGAG